MGEERERGGTLETQDKTCFFTHIPAINQLPITFRERRGDEQQSKKKPRRQGEATLPCLLTVVVPAVGVEDEQCDMMRNGASSGDLSSPLCCYEEEESQEEGNWQWWRGEGEDSEEVGFDGGKGKR
jgi:hypothetical protein